MNTLELAKKFVSIVHMDDKYVVQIHPVSIDKYGESIRKGFSPTHYCAYIMLAYCDTLEEAQQDHDTFVRLMEGTLRNVVLPMCRDGVLEAAPVPVEGDGYCDNPV